MDTAITLSVLHLLTYILAAFAIGTVLAAMITAAIYRAAIRPHITVAVPEVHLPDTLRVTIQQPPPPPAPMDRAQLWQEIYEETLDQKGYPSTCTDVMAATEAADSAIEAAFPNAAPAVPSNAPQQS